MRPAPTSTLFPYTTLFRSPPHADARAVRYSLRGRPRLSGYRAARPTTDRKSTRLNSSHTVISYAVFCLKKKTVFGEARARMDRAGGFRQPALRVDRSASLP